MMNETSSTDATTIEQEYNDALPAAKKLDNESNQDIESPVDTSGHDDINAPSDESIKAASTHSSSSTPEKEMEGTPAAVSDKTPLPPLSKILYLARPEFPMLFVALILMVAAEALTLITPLLLAQAYNFLVDPALTNTMAQINRVMGLVLILHFSGVVASFLRTSIMNAVGERVVARLRNQLYSCILSQDIAFFDAHKTGELVSRLSSDTTLLQQATSLSVPECVVGVVKAIVSLALMFWISPSLAGVTLGFIFIIFCLAMPFGKLMGRLSKQYQDVLGLAQTHSTEALGAMRTVQSFAAEDRERTRYQTYIGNPAMYKYWWPVRHKLQPTTYSVGFFKSIVASGFYTLIFGFGFGSLYLSLWFGFKQVATGQITLGALTAFQSYIFQIGGSLGQTSRYIQQLIEAQGASGRIFYLLERTPEIPKESDKMLMPGGGKDCSGDTGPELDTPAIDVEVPLMPVKPESMHGLVEFENVTFSYPSRPTAPVLRNFSLTIPANTTAALVGSSGTGKSTVVALLQRFYDVNSGSIRIDGRDIRSYDLKWLRSSMGFVQQEPTLFGLTCRENITYGVDRSVTDKELEDVCRMANAYEFIESFPERFETLVGERGVKLSGGQKQRLAIARALLVNPRILLLDEATSALDSESEHLVQEAIDKAVVGRTVLIVAHRLSTIQRAQQIVVVDDHSIVDIGNHGELMSRCTRYQDLIKRQSMAGQLPPDVLASMRVTR
ncbi:hypothetical protein MPSEU_000941000 [Mayamaea pseudoterrestris]|nr:hypothetical protein MPSEU_000941000 [Mayamaea pseudoterrestris]